MGLETSSPSYPTTPPAITIPPVPAQTYIHHTTLSPRPKIILIGDSITELGSKDATGWGTSLALRYNRRADVLNRGMNGYNSRWGLAALPLILEDIVGPSVPAAESLLDDRSESACSEEKNSDKVDGAESGSNSQKKKNLITDSINGEECQNTDQQTASSSATATENQHPQFTFIICYGANDSCLPNGAHSRHHVPLEEYTSNLKRMIQLIQTWNIHKSVSVAIMTPPPCDTEIQQKSRDNENVTRLYAESCIQLGSEMSVPVVNLWKGMQLPITEDVSSEEDLFESQEQWKTAYLSDGLHLTPMGNYRLYELVVDMLDADNSDSGLGMGVKTLPRAYPDHSMIDAEYPSETFSIAA